MQDLIKRIASEYLITEEQASKIIRLLQSPEAVDNNFWYVVKEVAEKRLKNEPII